MIVVKSLVFSVLLLGILGVAEVASTRRGKGRRLQQRPLAPAYQNNPIPVAQPQGPSYRSLPSGYPTPQALQQPARPIAPRPGLVVFGVGPNSLQIPNHYSSYAAAPQQTKPAVPGPAYASPTPMATQTPPRIQPATSTYAQPAYNQQNVEQTKYNSQPIQPAYPAPSPQYGNKIPAAQSGNYQQPSAQVVAVPASVPVPKLPESVPFYVAPAKSTVYGSAYGDNSASYPTSDSYTRGEASKPVESVPASYQSPSKKPQENYGTTATTSYNSKPTATYTGTKAEQSTEAYGKKTTQVKESQSYSSTPSPKVKYSTEASYSTTESKPTSGSYDKHSYSEKSKAGKDQYKKPVHPTSQSYKETESLSYGEKKKEIDSSSLPYSKVEAKPVSQSSKQDEYKESKQEDSKAKAPAYPTADSHKKGEYQKDQKEEVSVYSPSISSTKSETINKGKSYQSHTQTEKSYANKDKQQTPAYSTTQSYKDKPQTPAYSTTQSYKEEDAKSYGEQKKKVEEPSLSYSAVESKPVIESSKQNAYQTSTEGKAKVPTYSASNDDKKVESVKEVKDYKKQESTSYENKPVSDSYTKHSASYVEESQYPKLVVSTSAPYKKDDSNSDYKQKHYGAEPSSSKAAAVPTYEKYPSTSSVTQEPSKYHESNSKTYESKYPSVSPATKAPVKEVNTYSKPTSDESKSYSSPAYSTTSSPSYSTGYTTTTKASTISYEDKPKAYYTTTAKYKENSTSAKVVTQQPPAYKSTVEYAPAATTSTQKEDYRDQYSSKKDTSTKAPVVIEKSYATPTTTAKYNAKANDRVYVVSEQDEIVETYQTKEPVSSYPSYPNPSVDEKLSSAKQVVNQYDPSGRGYNSASSSTSNKSSYEGRPASSSAADLPAYNRKPTKEADILTTSVEGAKDSGKYGHDGVDGDYSAIPGKPEIDYPIYSELPNNKFNCSEQQLPGYYADTSARCQVFHICLGDRQWSFLCPNGTIFSQQHFVCVWWYEFDCSKAPALYEFNEKLFVIPSTQQALDYEGEQRAKAVATETLEETGKRYDPLSNKKETTSGAY
ncbi:adhesive plaque matrix protein-like [Daphnia carinata]|uniref:adhesive plaque matrix protein-like n=1 Tax=Daphnia carinata TaxID=120202 RepID=UPI00257AF63E|nr:adhesive plaque matrix protein-like [Daphnia carinata]